jgi:hypothetical protein
MYYIMSMKTLTVRVPDVLAAEIEAESRKRNVSKSDIVRERLTSPATKDSPSFEAIAHLVGSVKGLPPDLSANTKKYLRSTGYGLKRHR